MAFALPMDVDEEFADRLERRNGNRAIVNVGGAAAGTVQFSREDQRVVRKRLAKDRFQSRPQFRASDVEDSSDAKFFGPASNRFGRAALAKEQIQTAQ